MPNGVAYYGQHSTRVMPQTPNTKRPKSKHSTSLQRSKIKTAPAIEVIKHYTPNVHAIKSSTLEIPYMVNEEPEDVNPLHFNRIRNLSTRINRNKKSNKKITEQSMSCHAKEFVKSSEFFVSNQKLKSLKGKQFKQHSSSILHGNIKPPAFGNNEYVLKLNDTMPTSLTDMNVSHSMFSNPAASYIQGLLQEIQKFPLSCTTINTADELKSEISEYLISLAQSDISAKISSYETKPNVQLDNCNGFSMPESHPTDVSACAYSQINCMNLPLSNKIYEDLPEYCVEEVQVDSKSETNSQNKDDFNIHDQNIEGATFQDQECYKYLLDYSESSADKIDLTPSIPAPVVVCSASDVHCDDEFISQNNPKLLCNGDELTVKKSLISTIKEPAYFVSHNIVAVTPSNNFETSEKLEYLVENEIVTISANDEHELGMDICYQGNIECHFECAGDLCINEFHKLNRNNSKIWKTKVYSENLGESNIFGTEEQFKTVKHATSHTGTNTTNLVMQEDAPLHASSASRIEKSSQSSKLGTKIFKDQDKETYNQKRSVTQPLTSQAKNTKIQEKRKGSRDRKATTLHPLKVDTKSIKVSVKDNAPIQKQVAVQDLNTEYSGLAKVSVQHQSVQTTLLLESINQSTETNEDQSEKVLTEPESIEGNSNVIVTHDTNRKRQVDCGMQLFTYDDNIHSLEYIKIIDKQNKEILELTERLCFAEKSAIHSVPKFLAEAQQQTDGNLKQGDFKKESCGSENNLVEASNDLNKIVKGSGDDSNIYELPMSNTNSAGSKLKPTDKDSLSVHFMPPINIRSPLVTQTMPSIVIQGSKCTPKSKNITNTNVGYKVIQCKHDQNSNRCASIATRASVEKSQPVLETQPFQDFTVNVGTDTYVNNEEVVEDQNISLNESEYLCPLVERSAICQWPQSAKDIHNFVQEMMKDPNVELIYRSYQLFNDNNENDSENVEIDESALSNMDIDVYKTFVNPAGFKGALTKVMKDDKLLPPINFYSDKELQFPSNECLYKIESPISSNACEEEKPLGCCAINQECESAPVDSVRFSITRLPRNMCYLGSQVFSDHQSAFDISELQTQFDCKFLKQNKLATCNEKGAGNCTASMKKCESDESQYVINHDVSVQTSLDDSMLRNSILSETSSEVARSIFSSKSDDIIVISVNQRDINESLCQLNELEQTLNQDQLDEKETSSFIITHDMGCQASPTGSLQDTVIMPVRVITSPMIDLSSGDFGSTSSQEKQIFLDNHRPKVVIESQSLSNDSADISDGEVNKSDGELCCKESTLSVGEIRNKNQLNLSRERLKPSSSSANCKIVTDPRKSSTQSCVIYCASSSSSKESTSIDK